MDLSDDIVQLEVGSKKLKVRRLTLAEIRRAAKLFASSSSNVDGAYDDLLREHVSLEDGSELDPADLTLPQAQKLVSEMVGIPEGSAISDFIGLLC